ncbi:MAG: glycosyltransferase [archaeon GB-1867-005]|nr:glycosyltransferase [Candidatus Culexmicrobium cathedralense]
MISVVVPLWCEPREYLLMCLRSLNSQSLDRRSYEIILVDGCLNPDQEVYSLADKVLYAPRGKLHARHLGIVNARGDIIVSCDADTIYPYNYIEKITVPFHDPDVVAVAGTASWDLFWDVLAYPVKIAHYGSRLSGRASAFRKWAYFAVGGFDLTVNQGNWKQLELEEEIRFYRKLKQLGKVVVVDTNVKHLAWGRH